MNMKKLVALLLVAIMIFSFAACGEKKNEEQQGEVKDPKYGGSVVAYHTSFPVTCFMPLSTKDGDIPMLLPALEPLVRAQADGSVTPMLATEMKEDAQNLTLTITIREGVKFHDGSDLTPEVVAWNLQQYVDKGRAAYLCNPKSIEVKDGKVVVSFSEFSAGWQLAFANVLIVSKDAYDKNGEDYLATHPVGTGAFILDEYVLDESMTFKRNENYWGKDKDGNQLPYLDSITCVLIHDATSLVSAFMNGEVDEVQNLEGTTLQQILSAGYKNQSYESPANFSTTYAIPNTWDPESPWANDDVRLAVLNYGVDWDAVAKALSNGLGQASDQWTPTAAMAYDSSVKRGSYDPEKCKQLLADAGYPNGFSTILWTGNEEEHRQRATVMQDQLNKIGITSEVQLLDDTVIGQNRTSNTPGIYLGAGPCKMDMATYWNSNFSLTSGRWDKIIKYSDEYIASLSKALSAPTYEERAKAVKDASGRLFVTEGKVWILYIQNTYSFVNEKVHDMGVRQTDAYFWTPEICYKDK